jgi:hypothetical protein
MEKATIARQVEWAVPVLSVIAVLGFFAVVAVLLTRSVPEGAHDLLVLMLGVLISKFSVVYDFWMGSSNGSRQKDETIAAAQVSLANSVPAPPA